ncbi:malic acid transporter [Gaeumannomyces tritici R3-111a-1]|uniref:Malic acid transporter n=1 Tax=Gaeumannomyces tritici (strain R3-111a-1) TaxID=644352 RepID=J3NIP7_GAET3|nr:malic acid transporter [Gaeumannomyces tritici R3-111a-1]EJT81146.1 malic acid transporter [Gaeumannomyces tritici R3-111a-1]
MTDTRLPPPSARHSRASDDSAPPNVGPLPSMARLRIPQHEADPEAEMTKAESVNSAGSTADLQTTPSRTSLSEELGAPTAASDPDPAPLSPVRAAIRNFSSQWFLVPQGTGITSIVLFSLESRFDGLDVISYVVWAFTTVCLGLMLLAYALRLAMFPRHVLGLLGSDPAELTCMSSISIAFTSIVQMIALTAAGSSSDWAMAAVSLWWFNMVLAVASMIFIPYSIPHAHAPGVASLMPNTQLPMVAAITLAAGGGTVGGSPYLDGREDLRAPVLFFSYFSLALAVPIAMAYATMYLVRLVDGSPPARGKVYQEMIFCGPWGQGSFALQALGQALLKNAPALAAYMAGGVVSEAMVNVLGYSSVFLGFLSWSAGTFWWAFAVMSTVRHLFRAWRHSRQARSASDADGIVYEETERYSLAVWALVFPWGVYTNAAVRLGKVLASRFFRTWSTVLAICLVILMLVNLGLTVKGLWTGRLLGIDRRRRPAQPKGYK